MTVMSIEGVKWLSGVVFFQIRTEIGQRSLSREFIQQVYLLKVFRRSYFFYHGVLKLSLFHSGVRSQNI